MGQNILKNLTPDQLAQLNEDIKSISNFTQSNQFQNAITINISGTATEVAKTIASELEKLLAAQRRFAAI